MATEENTLGAHQRNTLLPHTRNTRHALGAQTWGPVLAGARRDSANDFLRDKDRRSGASSSNSETWRLVASPESAPCSCPESVPGVRFPSACPESMLRVRADFAATQVVHKQCSPCDSGREDERARIVPLSLGSLAGPDREGHPRLHDLGAGLAAAHVFAPGSGQLWGSSIAGRTGVSGKWA